MSLKKGEVNLGVSENTTKKDELLTLLLLLLDFHYGSCL
jgi:hypothetical protein